MKKVVDGIFGINENTLVTKNLAPGKTLFSEEKIKIKNKEYRIFSPEHSKLASTLIRGIKGMSINNDSTILYLGAAHGYTCSFLSDVVDKGTIFPL